MEQRGGGGGGGAASDGSSSSSSISDREQKLRASIHRSLQESGELERLQGVAKCRLIDSGWVERMKVEARKVVRARGIENVTFETLARDLTPYGLSIFPNDVRQELLMQVKDHIQREVDKQQ